MTFRITTAPERRITMVERSGTRELLRKGLAHIRRAARALDREVTGADNASTASKKRGASFRDRASEVRGREEVIRNMPKKKKAAKKKH